MQVSVEAGEGLQRKMSVEVPCETIDTEVENRLHSLKGRVKIDGFRPGKVPLKVVKQRYGDQVLHEVASEVMQRSFQDAVTQENLKLVGEPIISNQVIKAGEPLQFTAEFEIYPEIVVSPVADMTIERVSADVTDADLDAMLETLRKQQTQWSETDESSKEGDKVTIDFIGKVDGEVFEGGTANGVPVTIGSGSMIDDFEDKLIGHAKDAETTFEVKFPDDYAATNLAGQLAEFEVKITKVEQAELPELDDEFAKRYGVTEGGMDKFRGDVRNNLERELENRTKQLLKTSVMDQLIVHNDVIAPAAVVEEEMATLKNSAQQTGAAFGDDASYREEAERRVKLGLILGEVVKQANLQPSREMVNERIETMAQDYEDPAEFINHYQSNQELLRGVESLVVEDMMVDWIAEQATVTTVDKTFDELMNPSA